MKNFLKTQCANCKYYHGESYRGRLFVCANHPDGQENCPDFCSPIRLGLKKRIIIELRFFLIGYLLYFALTLPLVSFLIILNAHFEFIGVELFTLMSLIVMIGLFELIDPQIKRLYKRRVGKSDRETETTLLAGFSLNFMSIILILYFYY